MRLAVEYLLNHEGALRAFCTDGRLEIDNNASERMLRQWAVGRKNWRAPDVATLRPIAWRHFIDNVWKTSRGRLTGHCTYGVN